MTVLLDYLDLFNVNIVSSCAVSHHWIYLSSSGAYDASSKIHPVC